MGLAESFFGLLPLLVQVTTGEHLESRGTPHYGDVWSPGSGMTQGLDSHPLLPQMLVGTHPGVPGGPGSPGSPGVHYITCCSPGGVSHPTPGSPDFRV